MNEQMYGALSRAQCHFTVQCTYDLSLLLLTLFSYDVSFCVSVYRCLCSSKFSSIVSPLVLQFYFYQHEKMICISCSWIVRYHCSTAEQIPFYLDSVNSNLLFVALVVARTFVSSPSNVKWRILDI